MSVEQYVQSVIQELRNATSYEALNGSLDRAINTLKNVAI